MVMMQEFPTPIRLENGRALILPLEREHFEGLIAIAGEPGLWAIVERRMSTREEILAYLEEAWQEKVKGQSIPFVIFDKISNELAGSTRYAALSPQHKRLEIGWTWIGTRFQKTGLNRAVKAELLRYGFEELQLNRIELKADALNTPSRNAMKKMGATEEGILRNHAYTEKGRLRDTVYYSILKEEWPPLKKTVFAAFFGNAAV
jgi:RimJ/RimL family protein N-acetyltransferase